MTNTSSSSPVGDHAASSAALFVANPALSADMQWVLDHPGMSVWLKSVLRSAQDEDPISLQNDLEILNCLLGTCLLNPDAGLPAASSHP